jgi:ABC-type sugar transport system ATPase subunit
MSDRIVVLRDGIVVADLLKDETSEHELQNLVMTGGS